MVLTLPVDTVVKDRNDKWKKTSADDIAVIAKPTNRLDQLILDLTEGFTNIGLEKKTFEHTQELETHSGSTTAESGRHSGGVDRTSDVRGHLHAVERQLFTFDSTQDATNTRHMQDMTQDTVFAHGNP